MASPQDPRQKLSALRDLPQSIEPGRDLWPLIEARLKQTTAPATPAERPAPRRAQLRWLAAAAMVATLAVGVWIGRTLPGVATGGAPQSASRVPAPGLDLPSTLDASYVNDPRYERQRVALLASLQARLATMSPVTRDKVLASLATVEKAKEDLEQALGKDPSNALLQELLVNTYQDEMRVLTDVREASDPGRGI